MKILIATFDHNYYLWQCLVQINNFMKYGYDEDTVYIISSSSISPVLQSFLDCDKIKSKFFMRLSNRLKIISLFGFILPITVITVIVIAQGAKYA